MVPDSNEPRSARRGREDCATSGKGRTKLGLLGSANQFVGSSGPFDAITLSSVSILLNTHRFGKTNGTHSLGEFQDQCTKHVNPLNPSSSDNSASRSSPISEADLTIERPEIARQA